MGSPEKMNTRINTITLLSSLLAMPALAQTVAPDAAFPAKAVRFIVPFPPGGTIDTHARIVGQKLTEMWKQTAIIDNRPQINADTLFSIPP